MNAAIHVAVGVIRGPDNTVLVSLRRADSHQGGLWEFPGGKVESGETVQQALHRELHEELGITLRSYSPLCQITHDYGDKSVLLDVWDIAQFSGLPQGKEGQPLRWVIVDTLQMHEFPVANRPIIRRLQLPELIAITGTETEAGAFINRFEQVLAQSVRMVQLRVPELTDEEFRERASRCAELARIYNVKLLLNADPEMVLAVGADGFHANSRRLMQLQKRPMPQELYFGASCHNLEQLRHAEVVGADFVLLSPVQASSSHPDTLGLGWQRFAELASTTVLPCYALGGMKVDDLAISKSYGAMGIAAISAFW